jgi:hypothetical protein
MTSWGSEYELTTSRRVVVASAILTSRLNTHALAVSVTYRNSESFA